MSHAVSYDPQVRSICIELSDNEIVETLGLSESVYVDVDFDGVPDGLEVLDATSSLFIERHDAAALKELMHQNVA